LEYLIDFAIDIPHGTSATDVDQRAQAEAEHSSPVIEWKL
jgi:hypothetical protein